MSGPGQFSNPDDLAVDRAGNVYVADGSNNRVQVLTAGGQFVREFGTLRPGRGRAAVRERSCGGLGRERLRRRPRQRPRHDVRLGGELREGLGLGRRQRGQRVPDLHGRLPLRDRDVGRQSHEQGRVLRPPGDRRRRRRRRLRVRVRRRRACPAVRSARAERQVVAGLGAPGHRSPASSPGRSAWRSTTASNVFVADRDNYRVSKFTSTGSFLQTIGSHGTGAGQLNAVEDVAVDTGATSGSPKASTQDLEVHPGRGLPRELQRLPARKRHVLPVGDHLRLGEHRLPPGRPLRARLCLRSGFPRPPAPGALRVLELRQVGEVGCGEGQGVRQGPRRIGAGERQGRAGRRIRPADRGTDGSRPLDPRHPSRHGAAHRDARTAGKTQSGKFSAGVFQVLQSRGAPGLTELRLKGSSFKGCRGAGAKPRLEAHGPPPARRTQAAASAPAGATRPPRCAARSGP